MFDAQMLCRGKRIMRTTVNLDDSQVELAQALTGVTERSVLMRAALDARIQRESARRLARLGGTEPGMRAPRRRRARVKNK